MSIVGLGNDSAGSTSRSLSSQTTLGGRDLIEGYGHNALQRLPDDLQRRAVRNLNRRPAKGAYNMRGRCYAEHYTPTDVRSECPFSHVEMETLGIFSGYGFWDLELTTEDFERRLVAVDDFHELSAPRGRYWCFA
jgi:hypothetical protein